MLRSMFPGSGHRSILRIGPAGEEGSAMALINVDTYRHFGRLGPGAVMGSKKLKAMVLLGDGNFPLADSPGYAPLFQEVYQQLTATDMMRKYHDLGTPVNVAVLNGISALPCRNLQHTSDPDIQGITGERFADAALLRSAACAGCPWGASISALCGKSLWPRTSISTGRFPMTMNRFLQPDNARGDGRLWRTCDSRCGGKGGY